MNTRSTTWGLALAAITLTLTSACGGDIAPPSNDIGGVNNNTTTDVRPEQGTARLQHDDGKSSDQNVARPQYADDGGN